MITELELENFRTFSGRVRLRLRPITVLIGKNNAGKSSLIKFLLMLQQSIDATSSEFLVPDGDRVSLGTFADLRNSVRGRGQLKFRLEFQTLAGPRQKQRQVIDAILAAKPRIDAVTQRRDFHFFVDAQRGQEVVRDETMLCEITSKVGYGRRRMGSHRFSATFGDGKVVECVEKNLRTGRFLRFPAQGSDPEEEIKAYFADRYITAIRDEIADIRHLSAIREESQRVILVGSQPADDVGQRGEFAIPHLQRLIDASGDETEFVMRHLRAVAGIEHIKFYSPINTILARTLALNADTRAQAFLSEFGFGVSQCIPIFVQGAITPPRHLLMVEQPEAQLHPTAQIEMGSFFAELWRIRGVRSLVETHSSNIILRLRRLVAIGDLTPEDVTIGYVYVRDRTPIIRNLDIDEKGNVEKGLPMEFFGADVLESIKLGAKK